MGRPAIGDLLIMTEQAIVHRYDAVIRTPIGWVGITSQEGSISGLDILQEQPQLKDSPDPVAQQACTVLEDYFSLGNWQVDLPLAPEGTAFQQKVWQALRQIPGGRTVTYGELAEQLGSAPRAIGGACRANPIPLLIPCHRVVAANGRGGFAGNSRGPWVEIKHWLLEHEK